MILTLRSLQIGKPFNFRGCGWKRIHAPRLTDEDGKWLAIMEKLMESVFGKDYLDYTYDK
jgi:hypothetical protein